MHGEGMNNHVLGSVIRGRLALERNIFTGSFASFPSMNEVGANSLAVGHSLFDLCSVQYKTARADTACQNELFELWRP